MIKHFVKENILVIELESSLDATNSDAFKVGVKKLLSDNKFCVLQCENLNFIDSTGLGGFVSILKTATELGGDVFVANLQPKPRMAFEITRAFKILDVYDNLDNALSGIKQKI